MTFDQLTKGVPVVDAEFPVEFKTARRDVDGAVSRNPEKCVVARGARRSLNGAVRAVKIGAMFAYIYDGDKVLRYRLSQETREMVRAYDAIKHYPTGVPVKLLPVCKSQKLGTHQAGRKAVKPGTGKPNVRTAARPWLRHANQA